MAYIYKIINDINDKIYIGKTEFSIEKRFQEHCKDSKKRNKEKRPLYNAMNKYGIEHFHVELVEETDKPEEREIYWIKQFNSYHNGYNATLGGDGKTYLDRQLLIDTYLQNHNLTLTAKILKVDVGYLSKILKENNIEVKSSQEINKEKSGKKVEQYNLKGEYIQTFSSIKDATKAVKPNSNYESTHGHISQVCNGKRKTAYGYIWKFALPE